MNEKPNNHWTNCKIRLRDVKLEPSFFVGAEKEVNVLESKGYAQMEWRKKDVYFDRSFIVEVILRVVFHLYPLSADNLSEIFSDVIQAYVEKIKEKEEKNNGTK